MARVYGGGTISAALSAAYAGAAPMTVAVWARPASTSGRQRLVAYGDNDANAGLRGWAFGLEDANLRFTKFGAADIDSGTIGAVVGQWWLFAAVVTASKVEFSGRRPYGRPVQSVTSNAAGFNNSGADRLMLAGRPNGSGGGTDFFSGEIAEVSVWYGQLAEQDLVGLANFTLASQDIASGRLVGHWYPGGLLDMPAPDGDPLASTAAVANGLSVGSSPLPNVLMPPPQARVGLVAYAPIGVVR